MEILEKIKQDKEFSNSLKEIIKSLNLPPRVEISLVVIDLNKKEPVIGGYNMDHFIYPASVYKVFIGAEVLRQVEEGKLQLDRQVIIKSPNDVDKDARIFPNDTRPLLKAGDEVTVDYLLDLMLTRSDSTASNVLIDLVSRESIIKNIIHRYRWQGSEVTRKFLTRIKENKKYQFSQITMSCARHIAEFFYLVETGQLISSFVSTKLKEYMSQKIFHRDIGLYIPKFDSFYQKGGWYQNNLWKHNWFYAIKNFLRKGWTIIRWQSDAGVVQARGKRYVIAVLTVYKANRKKLFPMKDLSKKILNLM